MAHRSTFKHCAWLCLFSGADFNTWFLLSKVATL